MPKRLTFSQLRKIPQMLLKKHIGIARMSLGNIHVQPRQQNYDVLRKVSIFNLILKIFTYISDDMPCNLSLSRRLGINEAITKHVVSFEFWVSFGQIIQKHQQIHRQTETNKNSFIKATSNLKMLDFLAPFRKISTKRQALLGFFR